MIVAVIKNKNTCFCLLRRPTTILRQPWTLPLVWDFANKKLIPTILEQERLSWITKLSHKSLRSKIRVRILVVEPELQRQKFKCCTRKIQKS